MGEQLIDRMRREIMAQWAPPPDMTVSEWAEQFRFLSSDTSAAAGKWRNEKAPYQKEIMDAFTQRGVEKIIIESGAQCGKSEILMNMMGRTIDLDPGPMMMVQPSVDTADDFSKQRIASMIDCCPVLKNKVSEAKSRVSSNTIRLKAYPGGSLKIASAQSAVELRSKPVRFLLLDEVDAYPPSVGGEGDPVDLATARTTTFYNKKIVMVSTPTEERRSTIHREYLQGTQEEWSLPCPKCGQYAFLKFQDFETDAEEYEAAGRSYMRVKNVQWRCPNCKQMNTEEDMRKVWQKGKYIAKNERALENGVRSFHLNSFSSPWVSWKKIMKEWFRAKGKPEKEQVFTNVTLGEPWKRKTDALTTPEEIYKRREAYSAELPNGVLALTMGVDTQDNRLEYEVIGWGRGMEHWHIQKGVLFGRPDHPSRAVWKELDSVLDRRFKRENGKALRIMTTFVDSGGHCTKEVYEECAKRQARRVYAIKGEGGEGKEYVRMSSAMMKKGIFLFMIGVDSGKEKISYSLNVTKPGDWYAHFPSDPEAGYTRKVIEGYFTEKMVLRTVKGRPTPVWVKNEEIQARNEPLDCFNYALAAFMGFRVDLDEAERILNGGITRAEPAKNKKSGIRLLDEGIRV